MVSLNEGAIPPSGSSVRAGSPNKPLAVPTFCGPSCVPLESIGDRLARTVPVPEAVVLGFDASGVAAAAKRGAGARLPKSQLASLAAGRLRYENESLEMTGTREHGNSVTGEVMDLSRQLVVQDNEAEGLIVPSSASTSSPPTVNSELQKGQML